HAVDLSFAGKPCTLGCSTRRRRVRAGSMYGRCKLATIERRVACSECCAQDDIGHSPRHDSTIEPHLRIVQLHENDELRLVIGKEPDERRSVRSGDVMAVRIAKRGAALSSDVEC